MTESNLLLEQYYNLIEESNKNDTYYRDFARNTTLLIFILETNYVIPSTDLVKLTQLYYKELGNTDHAVINHSLQVLQLLLKYEKDFDGLLDLDFMPLYQLLHSYFFPKNFDKIVDIAPSANGLLLNVVKLAKPFFNNFSIQVFDVHLKSDLVHIKLQYQILYLLFLPATNNMSLINEQFHLVSNIYKFASVLDCLFFYFLENCCDHYELRLNDAILAYCNKVLYNKCDSNTQDPSKEYSNLLQHIPTTIDAISFIFVNQKYIPTHFIKVRLNSLSYMESSTIPFSLFIKSLVSNCFKHSKDSDYNNKISELVYPSLCILALSKHQQVHLFSIKSLEVLSNFLTPALYKGLITMIPGLLYSKMYPKRIITGSLMCHSLTNYFSLALKNNNDSIIKEVFDIAILIMGLLDPTEPTICFQALFFLFNLFSTLSDHYKETRLTDVIVPLYNQFVVILRVHYPSISIINAIHSILYPLFPQFQSQINTIVSEFITDIQVKKYPFTLTKLLHSTSVVMDIVIDASLKNTFDEALTLNEQKACWLLAANPCIVCPTNSIVIFNCMIKRVRAHLKKYICGDEQLNMDYLLAIDTHLNITSGILQSKSLASVISNLYSLLLMIVRDKTAIAAILTPTIEPPKALNTLVYKWTTLLLEIPSKVSIPALLKCFTEKLNFTSHDLFQLLKTDYYFTSRSDYLTYINNQQLHVKNHLMLDIKSKKINASCFKQHFPDFLMPVLQLLVNESLVDPHTELNATRTEAQTTLKEFCRVFDVVTEAVVLIATSEINRNVFDILKRSFFIKTIHHYGNNETLKKFNFILFSFIKTIQINQSRENQLLISSINQFLHKYEKLFGRIALNCNVALILSSSLRQHIYPLVDSTSIIIESAIKHPVDKESALRSLLRLDLATTNLKFKFFELFNHKTDKLNLQLLQLLCRVALNVPNDAQLIPELTDLLLLSTIYNTTESPEWVDFLCKRVSNCSQDEFIQLVKGIGFILNDIVAVNPEICALIASYKNTRCVQIALMFQLHADELVWSNNDYTSYFQKDRMNWVRYQLILTSLKKDKINFPLIEHSFNKLELNDSDYSINSYYELAKSLTSHLLRIEFNPNLFFNQLVNYDPSLQNEVEQLITKTNQLDFIPNTLGYLQIAFYLVNSQFELSADAITSIYTDLRLEMKKSLNTKQQVALMKCIAALMEIYNSKFGDVITDMQLTELLDFELCSACLAYHTYPEWLLNNTIVIMNSHKNGIKVIMQLWREKEKENKVMGLLNEKLSDLYSYYQGDSYFA